MGCSRCRRGWGEGLGNTTYRLKRKVPTKMACLRGRFAAFFGVDWLKVECEGKRRAL